MEFSVPQFIEREAKVVGPFTFKQFIFVASAGGLLGILFLLRIPLAFLFILGFFIMGFALALVFFKVGGFPLPVVIKNSFVFLFQPKIYLWRRKIVPPKIFEKAEQKITIEQERKESILKITERSRLNELSTFLQIKSR